MKYKNNEISTKWFANIEEIKEDTVVVNLLEVYPIRSLIKFYSIIPKIFFDKEHLILGLCFYVYDIKGNLEIEWIEKEELTTNQINKIDKEIENDTFKIKFD